MKWIFNIQQISILDLYKFIRVKFWQKKKTNGQGQYQAMVETGSKQTLFFLQKADLLFLTFTWLKISNRLAG